MRARRAGPSWTAGAARWNCRDAERWPSGLRRWTEIPVTSQRVFVGSNPTLSATAAKLKAVYHRVIDRLRRALPAGAVLWSAEELKPYECDALTLFRQTPLAVALPADEAQVAAVLRLCHEARVPVIARGAGTGLSGGATPRPDAVLLSMARLNRIIAVDPLARTARLQPGVRNLAISEAAAPHSLYY